MDIGFCSVLFIELWAINIGMELAWHRGFAKFLVESDSKSSIAIVQNMTPLTLATTSLKTLEASLTSGVTSLGTMFLREGN